MSSAHLLLRLQESAAANKEFQLLALEMQGLTRYQVSAKVHNPSRIHRKSSIFLDASWILCDFIDISRVYQVIS